MNAAGINSVKFLLNGATIRMLILSFMIIKLPMIQNNVTSNVKKILNASGFIHFKKDQRETVLEH